MINLVSIKEFEKDITEKAGEVFGISVMYREVSVKIIKDIAKNNFKILVRAADNYDAKTRTFKFRMVRTSEIYFNEVHRYFDSVEEKDSYEAVFLTDKEVLEAIARAGKGKAKPRAAPRRKSLASTSEQRHIAQEMLDDGVALTDEDIKHLHFDDRYLARKLSH